jgi:acyl-CoA thioester hydrolase
MSRAEALSGYQLTIAVPVWWGDQDAFGHVNNTVYFRWFESARIEYLNRVGLNGPSAGNTLGPIMAAAGCNFRRQLVYPDTVHVGARVTRIGRASFTMEHVVFSEKLGCVAADGASTLVVFDYAKNLAHPVPQEIRGRIESFEGHALPASASADGNGGS